MKIDKIGTATRLRAEDGMAIRRKGDTNPSTIREAWLSAIDSPDNWEDCEYGEPTPEESDEPTA